jgi:hypothetical protein
MFNLDANALAALMANQGEARRTAAETPGGNPQQNLLGVFEFLNTLGALQGASPNTAVGGSAGGAQNPSVTPTNQGEEVLANPSQH